MTAAITIDNPGDYKIVTSATGTGETVPARCVWRQNRYGNYECGCQRARVGAAVGWRYCPHCGRPIEWRAKP